METLYAVIDDLYDFTIGSVIRMFSRDTIPDNRQIVSTTISLPGETVTETHSTDENNEKSDTDEEEPQAPKTFKAVGTLIENRVASEEDRSHSIAYVASARVPLFQSPTKEFDSVSQTIPYGAMVMVLEERGRFSKISIDGTEGWVLRDDLADRAAYVYPEFKIGEVNEADDPNTLRLRAVIEDEFRGGEAEFPLQAGEYVFYKLVHKGLRIAWPPTRPRVPGRWHTILRGTPGIHIGIAPRGGSIMECTLEHDIGHLAYVEAVFPDERIVLSEANYPDRGIYNERTLVKEEWQALNPVFITVR